MYGDFEPGSYAFMSSTTCECSTCVGKSFRLLVCGDINCDATRLAYLSIGYIFARTANHTILAGNLDFEKKWVWVTMVLAFALGSLLP